MKELIQNFIFRQAQDYPEQTPSYGEGCVEGLIKIQKGKVIEMKKMMIVIIALAMVAVFLPQANAEETANLGLTVTFDINHPPEWKVEPQDATVIQGNKVVIELLAVDLDNDPLLYGCIWYLNGDRQEGLPAGAVFTWKVGYPVNPQLQLYPVIPINPPFPFPVKPNLTWDVPYDINPNDLYEFEFFVTEGFEDRTAGSTISKKIKVTVEQAVISIELEGGDWILKGVKLGEIRSNMDASNAPQHKVLNTGNINVLIGVQYGPMLETIVLQPIHPGLEQGLDTYVTWVGEAVLPPTEGLQLDHLTPPGAAEPLPLKYGAPKEVSEGITGMDARYEIRAYPMSGPIDIPIDY